MELTSLKKFLDSKESKMTDKIILDELRSYVETHGRAKAAVALGLKDGTILSKWSRLGKIPRWRYQGIKNLKNKIVIVEENSDDSFNEREKS